MLEYHAKNFACYFQGQDQDENMTHSTISSDLQVLLQANYLQSQLWWLQIEVFMHSGGEKKWIVVFSSRFKI